MCHLLQGQEEKREGEEERERERERERKGRHSVYEHGNNLVELVAISMRDLKYAHKAAQASYHSAPMCATSGPQAQNTQ